MTIVCTWFGKIEINLLVQQFSALMGVGLLWALYQLLHILHTQMQCCTVCYAVRYDSTVHILADAQNTLYTNSLCCTMLYAVLCVSAVHMHAHARTCI